MIYKNSLLKVGDNSGGKIVKCLRIVHKNKWGSLNGLVLVTLNKFIYGKKVKKKVFYLGLIVNTCYWQFRNSGFYIKFESNRVLLFSLQLKFLGSRVFGLLDQTIKKKIVHFKDTKFIYKMLGFSCKVL